jgi:hypothetical protein
MQICKIGSKNTYHKCLKDLHATHYIIYRAGITRHQPVKITIIRLDKKQDLNYEQLDLFKVQNNEILSQKVDPFNVPILSPQTPSYVPNMGHALVPDLIQISPNIDTGTVPNMGHLIKHKQINSVCKTHTSVFEKNKKIQNAINNPPFRDKEENHATRGANSVHIPTLSEVEEFFKTNKYPLKEARKFYYYNNGKAWKLPGKLPIADWQSLAHKWILNSGDQIQIPPNTESIKEIIKNLYERFLKDEQIAKEILPGYADRLQLEITDSIKREAIQRRINQLSGSNENADNKLLQAYLNEHDTNPQLIHDLPNLMALCKRLAVLKTFQQWKASG